MHEASDYIENDTVEDVATVRATEDVANQPVVSLHAIACIRT